MSKTIEHKVNKDVGMITSMHPDIELTLCPKYQGCTVRKWMHVYAYNATASLWFYNNQ